MVAGIWGQTRNLGDRTLELPDLTKHRSDGRGWLQHPDMGAGTMSGTPIRNVQRETFNSQLSTGLPKWRMVGGIWGQTRYLGDRVFGWPDLPKRRSGGGGYRGTQIWGQARCLTGWTCPGACGGRPDMGTDTEFGRPGF